MIEIYHISSLVSLISVNSIQVDEYEVVMNFHVFSQSTNVAVKKTMIFFYSFSRNTCKPPV